MITLGIDLASQPRETAACRVRWLAGGAEVDVPELGVDDERLLELALDADKVGIDVPFGWPEVFVDAVVAHRRGAPWPQAGKAALRYRETDRFVWQQTRRPPLSVSSDRIALCAMRAASLMSTLAQRGEPVDRTGRGKLVEVYPAAALRRWGVQRADLLGRLRPRLSPEVEAACQASRDALDALIAAVVARAAALGLCDPIPEDTVRLAEREGWIALPAAGSLDRLLSSSFT